MNNWEESLKSLGENRLRKNVWMRDRTYFRIGGVADFYYEAKTTAELVATLRLCREEGIPFFVMGLGSNILVGDKGVRGLVIKVANSDLEIVGPYVAAKPVPVRPRSGHFQTADTKNYLRFDDLEGEEPLPDTLVRVGAGVPLFHLIDWTLERGLTGLQYFAGIPSSLGGCVYNNIHGGTKLFDQWVQTVTLWNEGGQIKEVSHDDLAFAYDYCRIQKTGEIILAATLKMAHGDVEKAKAVRDEWQGRKARIQPQINCSGCIFKNLSEAEAKRIGAPVVSAGWVIDMGLGLKGTKIGGIEISQKHANFFVNDGTGKASDVLALMELVKEKVKEKFNLDLQEEIQRVGEF